MPTIYWITPDRFDAKPDKSSWLEMARLLQVHSYQVRVLAAGPADQSGRYPDVVEYLEAIDANLIFRISLLIRMARWLSRHLRKEDIVILNPDALWLVPVLRRLGANHIHLDIRTLPVNTTSLKGRIDRWLFWSWTMRLFARRVDSYSYITESLKQAVAEEFQLVPNDYSLWQSAVDVEAFVQTEAMSKATPAMDNSAEFSLLYHGSINLRRGIGEVIEGLAKVKDQCPIHFTVVGDGPDRMALEALAERLGIADRVTFTGFLPYEEIAQAIWTADVGICPLPDYIEWNVSSPLKVFEYMACERPIILTPIAAHTDVLDDAPFVEWTKGYEAEDFADAIVAAWQNRDALAKAARQASQRVEQKHTWRVQAQKLGEHLNRVIGMREVSA